MDEAKQSLIESIVKTMLKRGFTTRRLRAALNACWDNGAVTALMSPETAFQSVHEDTREMNAAILIARQAKDFLAEQGLKSDNKTLLEWAHERMEGDETYPVAVLTPGEDWLIGRRSSN